MHVVDNGWMRCVGALSLMACSMGVLGCQTEQGTLAREESIEGRAMRLTREVPLIDGHNDTAGLTILPSSRTAGRISS